MNFLTRLFSTVRPIGEAELPQVADFYRSVVGTPGCTWDAFYPNEETLQEDYNTSNLYGLYIGKRLVAAASVVPENELDDLDCWHCNTDAREIARIVVPLPYQGKGYSKPLVSKICRLLARRGCRAVHLLVAVNNERAKRLYHSIGFCHKGRCFRYGLDFYAYELTL